MHYLVNGYYGEQLCREVFLTNNKVLYTRGALTEPSPRSGRFFTGSLGTKLSAKIYH